MKFSWLFTLLIFGSCNNDSSSKKVAALPSPQILDSIIRARYTSQNKMDGIEFATVDSLEVKATASFEDFTRVTYFIHCSFQQAVRPPGSETGIRPPIHQVDSIDIRKEGEKWSIVTQ